MARKPASGLLERVAKRMAKSPNGNWPLKPRFESKITRAERLMLSRSHAAAGTELKILQARLDRQYDALAKQRGRTDSTAKRNAIVAKMHALHSPSHPLQARAAILQGQQARIVSRLEAINKAIDSANGYGQQKAVGVNPGLFDRTRAAALAGIAKSVTTPKSVRGSGDRKVR